MEVKLILWCYNQGSNKKREREYFIESVLLTVYKVYGELDKEFEVDSNRTLNKQYIKANGRIDYENELKNQFLNKGKLQPR